MNTFNTKVNELIPIIKNHLEHYNVSLDQVDSYKTNLAEYNKQFVELNKLIKTEKARLRLESKVKSKEDIRIHIVQLLKQKHILRNKLFINYATIKAVDSIHADINKGLYSLPVNQSLIITPDNAYDIMKHCIMALKSGNSSVYTYKVFADGNQAKVM